MKLTALLPALLISLCGYAQQYHPPVNIPIELSGNFGELRHSHFHAGLDIRTNGQRGLPVFSIEEGYVSRVRVSERGYGKAVYITHPGGKVSVYAHLDKFNDSLEPWIRRVQYQLKSYSVDTMLNPFSIRVNRGELIGISGNSGSSGGPHLHFEIRNQYTENPHNPMHYGFTVKDRYKPLFHHVRVYPLDGQATVKGYPAPAEFNVSGVSGNYQAVPAIIPVSGRIGIGVSATDRADLPGYTLGLYKLEMKVNGKMLFSAAFDSLSFSTGRAIHAYTDYKEFICAGGERYQKTWVPEINRLFNLQTGSGDGSLMVQQDSVYQVVITATDFNDNRSVLSFSLKGAAGAKEMTTVNHPGKSINAGDLFLFNEKDIWLEIPGGSFYDDQQFQYVARDTFDDGTTRFHHIHDACVPVFHDFRLMLRIPSSFQNKDRVMMVREDTKGNRQYYAGVRTNDMLLAEVNAFGKYYLEPDLAPPEISLLASQPVPRFRVTDKMSGVSRYDLYINDSWHLSAWDPRTDILAADGHNLPSSFNYKLVVFDRAGNMAVYEGKR